MVIKRCTVCQSRHNLSGEWCGPCATAAYKANLQEDHDDMVGRKELEEAERIEREDEERALAGEPDPEQEEV